VAAPPDLNQSGASTGASTSTRFGGNSGSLAALEAARGHGRCRTGLPLWIGGDAGDHHEL
jgi:hypothetical protein